MRASSTWETKVADVLPGFKMYDPYVSSEMTVRDLVVHRSGLGPGAGDLLFFPPTTFTRAEIIHKLRFIKPVTSFRSGFAYDNLLYIVAGEVIATVEKSSWEDVDPQANSRAAADERDDDDVGAACRCQSRVAARARIDAGARARTDERAREA